MKSSEIGSSSLKFKVAKINMHILIMLTYLVSGYFYAMKNIGLRLLLLEKYQESPLHGKQAIMFTLGIYTLIMSVILHCMFDIIYHFLKIMLSPIEIHIVITEVGGRTGVCAYLMSG